MIGHVGGHFTLQVTSTPPPTGCHRRYAAGNSSSHLSKIKLCKVCERNERKSLFCPGISVYRWKRSVWHNVVGPDIRQPSKYILPA